MPAPVRIWLEISHHGPFRTGGWAWVREAGGEVTGRAGGARRIEAERAALLGLVAALEGVAQATLHTSSAAVAAVPARIAAAQAGEDAPADNLDLWAQLSKALAGVKLVRVAPAPGGPSAFAAGWAEFGRDKAKDQGDFTNAIPKTNLSKAGV